MGPMWDKHDEAAGDDMVGPHESAADHGADHGHDDNAHGEGAGLGPPDLQAWGAALLGGILGLAVVAAFLLAVS
jgi:hypothetical protein